MEHNFSSAYQFVYIGSRFVHIQAGVRGRAQDMFDRHVIARVGGFPLSDSGNMDYIFFVIYTH